MKPYVPYNIEAKEAAETTPEMLFDAIYTDKVHQDYKSGKIFQNSSIDDIAKLDSLKRRWSSDMWLFVKIKSNFILSL